MYPFPKQSKEIWLEKLSADLKGKTVESLDFSIAPGITMSPFYHKEDLPYFRKPLRNNNSWEIGQTIAVHDIKKANKEALAYLQAGVEALQFNLTQSISVEELTILLKEINLQFISTAFYPSSLDKEFSKTLKSYLQHSEYSIEALAIQCIGDETQAIDEILSKAARYAQFQINTNQSNSVVDQLATMLFETNRIFINHKTDNPWNYTQWNISTTNNYILNIAIIRATRMMLHKIITSYQEDWEGEIFITASCKPSSENENIDNRRISACAQAAAAICGGANRILINSGSEAFFDRRIDQNIQQILKLESYLNHVGDPAAGSYFIEEATDAIIDKVWPSFQKLEKTK